MSEMVATPDFGLLFDQYLTRQQGLFTTLQAYNAGYSRQSQSYHVLTGNWERYGRGIFRFKHYPRSEYLDLIVAYLWATDRTGKSQGIISHTSALHCYNLATAWPSGVDLTVPKNFRRESRCPVKINLHRGEVSVEDTEHFGFMRISSSLRTIVDLLVSGNIESKHLREAILDSIRKGLISYWDLLESKLTEREEQLLFDLLQSINYKELNELRQSRKLKTRSA